MDALASGHIDHAEERFAKAVEQDSTDWKSLYYLGLVRLEQNRPTAARLLLEQALSIREDNEQTSDILDALAESLFIQGDYDRLHAMLKRASHERNSSGDYIRQGRYMAKMGGMDEAHVAFRTAVRLASSNDTSALIALADFYESVGDKAAAVNALRAAYSITPRDAVLATRLRAHGIVPGPTVALPAQDQQ